MSGYRIGVDIGGTFTDVVLLDDDGNVISKKISSSVDDYALAIVEGLESLFAEHGTAPAEVAGIMHGTTVASNAILELAGARVGLVTSRGFRDVLELRHSRIPRLYDLTWEKPPPLVERYLSTCCRRSRSTSAPRPRWSTPTCCRSSGATCGPCAPGSTPAASAPRCS